MLCDVADACCETVDDALETEDVDECDVALLGVPVITVTDVGCVLAWGVPVMEGGPK